VVAQAIVPFQPGDTLADFEARMHGAEHELIVEAVEQWISKQCAVGQ
jgi:folate-dependent phosphoribosylglycinamide formyltransferase PurN